MKAAVCEKQFQVISAGVAASHGAPASIETRNILLDHGIDFTPFRSQPVTAELIKDADYVFCMSRMHRAAILNSLPEEREKVLCVGEFLGGETPADVADPFGLGEPAYRKVEEELLTAIENIRSFISEQDRIEKELET